MLAHRRRNRISGRLRRRAPLERSHRLRAVRLNVTEGPQALHVETIADPAPGAGEVLVGITHAAFNRRDVYISQGLYPKIDLPRTLGSDGTGTVAALGPGVTGIGVGAHVVIDPQLGWGGPGIHAGPGESILGMPRDGTFAELVVVPAPNVFRRPAGLSAAEAAAIPLAGLTAYRAIFTRGRITKDDVVLVTGIGGGVATFVLQFAVHAGARTLVTSGSDAKLVRAKELGAAATFNYRDDPNWHKAVRAASDGGPTLIVDSSGGETFAKCLEIARPGARVVVYGGTGGDATIRPYAIFWKHLDVLGTSMGSPDDFAAMLGLFEKGLRPAVDGVFAMEDCAAAARRLLNSEQFGKVVLAIA